MSEDKKNNKLLAASQKKKTGKIKFQIILYLTFRFIHICERSRKIFVN